MICTFGSLVAANRSLAHPEANAKIADEAEREDSGHESDDRRRSAAIISPERFLFGGRENSLFVGHSLVRSFFRNDSHSRSVVEHKLAAVQQGPEYIR